MTFVFFNVKCLPAKIVINTYTFPTLLKCFAIRFCNREMFLCRGQINQNSRHAPYGSSFSSTFAILFWSVWKWLTAWAVWVTQSLLHTVPSLGLQLQEFPAFPLQFSILKLASWLLGAVRVRASYQFWNWVFGYTGQKWSKIRTWPWYSFIRSHINECIN